jgi:phosphoserine phosphatase
MGLTKITFEKLKDRLYRESPPNAPWIFDCDGTLIKGDIASMSAWALIRFGMAHSELLPKEYDDFKELPFDYETFQKLREIIIAKKGTQSIYEWEAFLHSGLPPQASYDIAKIAIEEGLKLGHFSLTKTVSTLAQERAQHSWIVSGSPHFCVWAVADKIGIPRQRVLASKLETVDDISAPRIQPPGIIWEELKRTILLQNGVSNPFLVAGDTLGDWQMMEMATHWCWAVVWGPHRHRGEEMRDLIDERVLKTHGLRCPPEAGLYILETSQKNWVIEVRSKE